MQLTDILQEQNKHKLNINKMESFKIKIDNSNKSDFIRWVYGNINNTFLVPILDGPYFFVSINKATKKVESINQSTKFFSFKYSIRPEYVMYEGLPTDKLLPEKPKSILWKTFNPEHSSYLIDDFSKRFSMTVDNTSKELADLIDKELLSEIRKEIDRARIAYEKLRGRLRNHPLDFKIPQDIQLDTSIKDRLIYGCWDDVFPEKPIKKLTEKFSIDIEKVDRLEAEKCIRQAGYGLHDHGPYMSNSTYLDHDTEDNDFFYHSAIAEIKIITSIDELRGHLGLTSKPKEKEYVLKKTYYDKLNKDREHRKNTPVYLMEEKHFNSSRNLFKIHGTSVLVTDKYVEEIHPEIYTPLLSDIVKVNRFIYNKEMGTEWKYLGKTVSGVILIRGLNTDIVTLISVDSLNNNFKLNR